MANTYELISSSTVGSGGASSINFSSIPSTFTDLLLKVCARGTADRNSSGYYFNLTINTLTTNQSSRYINGNGIAAQSGSFTRIYGYCAPSDSTASTFSNNEFYFTNYNSSSFKSVSLDGVNENNGQTSDSTLQAGLWSSTSAITALGLVPAGGSFAQYSTAYLYGIKSS
jgi:hypothetical protein